MPRDGIDQKPPLDFPSLYRGYMKDVLEQLDIETRSIDNVGELVDKIEILVRDRDVSTIIYKRAIL